MLEAKRRLPVHGSVEMMIGALRTSAIEKERQESDFYDEIARDIGFCLNLTHWQYWWLRDALDAAVASGKGRTDAERNLLVLEYAMKVKNLSAAMDSPGVFEANSEQLALELEILRLTSEIATKHRLTNWEFRYLASVINTRANPKRPRGPIDPKALPMVIENSAEQILRKRRSRKRLAFWRNWDPLAAQDELEERAQRVSPKQSVTSGA